MGRYIWQRTGWPRLTSRSEELLVALGRVRHAQGELAARAEHVGLEARAEVLVDEAMTTAAIEGESLPRDAVHSSVARRLGLATAGLPVAERHVDGLVEMLMDAPKPRRALVRGTCGWLACCAVPNRVLRHAQDHSGWFSHRHRVHAGRLRACG
ncbi:MAG: hypothetical protein A2341_20995 [Deltaproteobacteria bacterium RIFOXYB12_FULL_58_9]|nr:MAG: hypothetical protein A2341_20995 [Deltaproteobacteria bacterium RIFOXYB12_FULL_58_9]